MAKITESNTQALESRKPKVKKTRGIFVLIQKTFFDLYSLKKILITITLLVLLPIIFISISISASGVNFDLVSIEHATTTIGIGIVLPLYFWTFGIAFAFILGTSGAPLIAEEVNSGTMLILVSKPISRVKIFVGKYVAIYLYGMVLSFVSIFTIGWVTVLIHTANLDHFISLLPFLVALYLYSLVILFLFVSVSLAFSSIFKKSRNAAMMIVFLFIFAFLAFQLIRTLVGDSYATYQLYHFDLGYHLGNIFNFFLESLNAIPPSWIWQSSLSLLTGVYDLTPPIDPDQNIFLGGLAKTNYYLPIHSLIIWLVIAGLLLLYGIVSLKKREISG